MRATTFAALAVVLAPIAVASAARAADFEPGPLRGTQYEAPLLTPVQTWHGGYFGAFAGVAISDVNFEGSLSDLVARAMRLTAIENELGVSQWLQPRGDDVRDTAFGVFAGYNYQIDEAVLGVEIDYTRARAEARGEDTISRFANTSNGYMNDLVLTGATTAELRDFGTMRVRAGYTMGSFLPFVTAGVGLGRWVTSRTATVSGNQIPLNPALPTVPFFVTDSIPDKETYAFGLTAGLGMDVALSENVFVRGEWQYIYFNDIDGLKANINSLRAAGGIRF